MSADQELSAPTWIEVQELMDELDARKYAVVTANPGFTGVLLGTDGAFTSHPAASHASAVGMARMATLEKAVAILTGERLLGESVSEAIIQGVMNEAQEWRRFGVGGGATRRDALTALGSKSAKLEERFVRAITAGYPHAKG